MEAHIATLPLYEPFYEPSEFDGQHGFGHCYDPGLPDGDSD